MKLAVIGAGPVGLALALHAARMLPRSRISLFDARPIELDVARDPRTIALSLGSVQLLQRLHAWDAQHAQPILEVHVSQQPPTWTGFGTLAHDAELRIRAIDEGVPMLGAVLQLRPDRRAAAGGVGRAHARASRSACTRASARRSRR